MRGRRGGGGGGGRGRRKGSHDNTQLLVHESSHLLVSDAAYGEIGVCKDPDHTPNWEDVAAVYVQRVTSRQMAEEECRCPVCLDVPVALTATPCGHLFCAACITRSVTAGNAKSASSETSRGVVVAGSCPICGRTVSWQELRCAAHLEVGRPPRDGSRIDFRLIVCKKDNCGVPYPLLAEEEEEELNIYSRTSSCSEVKIFDRQLKELEDAAAELLEEGSTECEAQVPFLLYAADALRLRKKHWKERRRWKMHPETNSPPGVMRLEEPPAVMETLLMERERQAILEAEAAAAAAAASAALPYARAAKGLRLDNTDPALPVPSHALDNPKEEELWPDVNGNDPKILEKPLASVAIGVAPREGGRDVRDGGREEKDSSTERNRKNRGSKGRNGIDIDKLGGKSYVYRAETANALSDSVSPDSHIYYYQASDGRPIYLHPLCMKILQSHFGSWENLPYRIVGTVVEVESMQQTPELRRRVKICSRVPRGCAFDLVEINLMGKLPAEVTSPFEEELHAREARRKRERQRAKYAAAKEKRQSARTKQEAGPTLAELKQMPSLTAPSVVGNPTDFPAISAPSTEEQNVPTTTSAWARVAKFGFASGVDAPVPESSSAESSPWGSPAQDGTNTSGGWGGRMVQLGGQSDTSRSRSGKSSKQDLVLLSTSHRRYS